MANQISRVQLQESGDRNQAQHSTAAEVLYKHASGPACCERAAAQGRAQSTNLEGGGASVLSADGVPIVGPHDLIDAVALEGQRLLWRHHAQLLQLWGHKEQCCTRVLRDWASSNAHDLTFSMSASLADIKHLIQLT